jgi:uncharacterized protein YdaU (DUF1376 family)
MKKPTAYLPFYGNDFFQAVAGYPEAVAIRYLRALWHYWNHTGCEGLPDDDAYLSLVCGCQGPEWAGTRSIIFDDRYHFRLENGVWHQPRCRDEWAKSKHRFDSRSRAGKLAANARWGRDA